MPTAAADAATWAGVAALATGLADAIPAGTKADVQERFGCAAAAIASCL